jgi:hypothetical protein
MSIIFRKVLRIALGKKMNIAKVRLGKCRSATLSGSKDLLLDHTVHLLPPGSGNLHNLKQNTLLTVA